MITQNLLARNVNLQQQKKKEKNHKISYICHNSAIMISINSHKYLESDLPTLESQKS